MKNTNRAVCRGCLRVKLCRAVHWGALRKKDVNKEFKTGEHVLENRLQWSRREANRAAASSNKSVWSSRKFPAWKRRTSRRSCSVSKSRAASTDAGATGGELDEPIDPSWPGRGGGEGGRGGGGSPRCSYHLLRLNPSHPGGAAARLKPHWGRRSRGRRRKEGVRSWRMLSAAEKGRGHRFGLLQETAWGGGGGFTQSHIQISAGQWMHRGRGGGGEARPAGHLLM